MEASLKLLALFGISFLGDLFFRPIPQDGLASNKLSHYVLLYSIDEPAGQQRLGRKRDFHGNG